MKFSFIRKTSLQVKDRYLKDGEFSKWLLSILDKKKNSTGIHSIQES